MNIGALGKVYQDGETIIRKGEIGDCMYVIQDGCVEVITEIDNQRIADSYTSLFSHLKEGLGLNFRDLSFENFKAVKVTPHDLGVLPADK